ncbi:FeoB-associated Cys-rich membrane protein [Curvibacter sp. APW13]|uniref:FeoB-associated Cys-rich membrane protein n=1 Tax=Curvibacter sp. APW13 TaxID=3077236 RepID=UPI0028DEA550|nr:FeoB-associated Cys-rich membrane protein [Curvibacter sp. APW13]MDT8991399.1 FeoB-associated Cys-rich membrane protein [Curvibacter sp. APW13]
MQTLIVTVVVLACAAAVLRGLWKQFSAQGGGGCGGCGSAKSCKQSQMASCGSAPAVVQESRPVHWQPRRQD